MEAFGTGRPPAGLMMQPQKKRANGIVADAVRTVSDVTDTIRDTMGW